MRVTDPPVMTILWPFFRFLTLGGFATVVNIVCRFLLNRIMSFEAAIFIAYCVGMVVAFALFRVFVFDMSKSSLRMKEVVRFVAVNLWGMGQTLVLSIWLVSYIFPPIGMTFRPHDVAHVLALSALAITSYAGHKYFTFK